MPLFDFFKKSNKKEPPQRPTNGNEGKSDQKDLFLSPERQKKRYETAMEFLYVVYVTALIVEMESKISQSDFVNADADQLAQQLNGKPEEKIPLYVRQMLWLRENAEKFGYQRSGNSWMLKL